MHQASKWRDFYDSWLNKYNGTFHIVHYENLKNNLRMELRKLATFLNQTVTEKDLDCVIWNQRGKYKRPSQPLKSDPYTPVMKEEINKYIKEIYTRLLQIEGNEAEVLKNINESKNLLQNLYQKIYQERTRKENPMH